MRAPALAVGEHVDRAGAGDRADRELGALDRLVRAEHAPVGGQRLDQRQRLLDPRLGVVGDQDHGVLGEELLQPAGGLDQLGEGGVGAGDRLDLGLGTELVGVMVVVGQREEQEVIEVALDQLAPGARRVLVAGPGARQRRLAVDRLAGSRARRRRARPAPRSRGGSSPRSRPGAAAPRARARGGCGRDRSETACRRCGRRRRRDARSSSPPRGRGGTCSCCRRCRRASGRGRRRASPRTSCRTRRSAPRRGDTSCCR